MATSIADPRPTDPSTDDVQPSDDSSRSESSRSELCELVERYAVAEFLPPAEWVTRLSLVQPRDNLRCLSHWIRFKKRTLDVCVSFVALILLSPVMLLTAILVKLTSRDRWSSARNESV
ncbi:MAG: sugar transferase [Planctomycetota bacterium]|nr:sugar transferase [Planctomycetota bacterium]MDA1251737.1 sugar transferase [Planctomycetota bacterium]